MSKYPNLPGIEVQVADGGLILPEDAASQSMLIIAPSTEVGAPTEPVLIRQHSDLVDFGFGDFLNSAGVVNPIVAAWKAAYDGGCRRIFVMALEGNDTKSRFMYLYDKLFGILADFQVDHVVAVGVYADEEASNVTANDFANPEDQAAFPNLPGVMRYGYVVETDVLNYNIAITATTADTIIINKGGTQHTITLTAKVYDGMPGKTLEDLANDINAEFEGTAELKNFKAIVRSGKIAIIGDAAFTITGGTALTALRLASGSAAVKRAEDEGTIYAGNFAKLLGDYAETQTKNHNSTIAYIGVAAPTGNTLTEVKAKVDALVQLYNEYSPYVSVVAGPELGYRIPGKNDLYYTNGVVTYAALVSILRPESAPTNKPVYGVAGMHYVLSLRQLNMLTGNKFVTFRLKNNQVVVTDGITTAPDLVISGQRKSSDFIRLSTLRITQAAIELIREVCEPFLGEPNRMPQYNALNATIKGALEGMKSSGAIMDYRFTVVARGASLNEAVVTLEIVPTFELRKISVDVALRPQLEQ